MNSNDIKIDVFADNRVVEKAIIIQSLFRGRHYRKKVSKFRKTVSKVVNCEDTIRITPSKFEMPLYITQQTCAKKYCGESIWKNVENLYENSSLLYIIFSFWLISMMLCSYIIYKNIQNVLLYVLTITFSLPLLVSYFIIIQDKMLKLLVGSFECKLHLFLNFFACIIFSDIFRDYRCLLIWSFIFPITVLITLIDALPRYLFKTKRLLILISLVLFICDGLLAFYTTLGEIEVNVRNFVFVTNIKKSHDVNTTIYTQNRTYFETDKERINIVLSNVSYGISFLQSVMILILKNVMWYYRNPHRAVILKSPVNITGVGKWEMPIVKKIMYKRFFPMKKTILKERHHKI